MTAVGSPHGEPLVAVSCFIMPEAERSNNADATNSPRRPAGASRVSSLTAVVGHRTWEAVMAG